MGVPPCRFEYQAADCSPPSGAVPNGKHGGFDSAAPARQAACMLLWAGLVLIVIGAACFAIDRRAAHYLYDHESARFERFLENTTHWAKASHWLIGAVVALGAAQAVLALWGERSDARAVSDYALAFIVCLGAGSAILHGMKLVV